MPTPGAELKALRKSLVPKCTQQELADEMGISRPALANIEHWDAVRDDRAADYRAAVERLREQRNEISNQTPGGERSSC